jgi:hypothetical protein
MEIQYMILEHTGLVAPGLVIPSQLKGYTLEDCCTGRDHMYVTRRLCLDLAFTVKDALLALQEDLCGTPSGL